MFTLAQSFEELARGVLNACFEESVDKAKLILYRPLLFFRWVRTAYVF